MPYVKGAKTKPIAAPTVVGESSSKEEIPPIDKDKLLKVDEIMDLLIEDAELRSLLLEELVDTYCLICAASLGDDGHCEEGCDEDDDEDEEDEGDDGEPDDELEEEDEQ
jgi:hypothetical protein